ncbi:major facilitator superfamily MFS_1 [Roseobacter sp. SK209-2-6]|uniref:MFS transporter n=1 Tax=Roseobacter sp. SK209-2-6 TaxID=388739 RepID=UPI0000F3EE51|nr:MFS transporter [Roseobacter sp. SK209-2-6]EBA16800.1 major facilitator superfamily MFS_1 [Roseobacter sp. SK209-2-6]
MTQNVANPLSPPIPFGTLAVLWLVGWTLRVHILAAPPLATRIAESFGLGEAAAGALTMLPVVAVAFGAIPAAWIIARFGLRAAVVTGLLVMTVASVARGQVPSASMLFVASAIMGLGVAVFQTALPAATRVWTPTHVALGSAVYLNGMMMGELSGAGLTLPVVLPLAGGDWRFALVLWSIPILLITMLVALVRLPKVQPNTGRAALPGLCQEASLPRWNDVRVWQYGLLLSSSVVAFFVINAYSGSLLQSRGESHTAGAFHFAYNATPVFASFVVLLAPKWVGSRRPIAVSALFAWLGLAGFFLLKGWASWGSALVAGFAATIELILLVSLPPVIAKGIAVTRLSAGMTLIGFSIAFLLTLLGGWLADSTGWIEMALTPSLIFMMAAFATLGRTAHYPNYY